MITNRTDTTTGVRSDFLSTDNEMLVN